MNDMLGLLMSMEDGDIVREQIVKAPFAWPGGKQNSIKMILPHLPYTPYYREVFGGSGAILLARQKVKHEVYNDRASGITDFYHVLKNRELLPKLLEWISFTPFSREEFLRCRDTWQNVNDPVERAARWYLQVMMSFQGYGRNFGRTKQANSQFAMKIPNQLKNFHPVHYRLVGTYIENQPWQSIFRDFDNPSAVFFCDPPYLNTSNGGMYEHQMSHADHVELCERIFHTQGFVALSGYPNTLYDKYPWDKTYEWDTRSTASAGIGTESNHRQGTEGTNDSPRIEKLWIKEFGK